MPHRPPDIQTLALNGMPLVSIITPSYNAIRFIKDNIESVKSQEYPAIEHIICDGASVDGTRQLLGESSHLIWQSEPDRGQSDALNKGFQRARGEIIGWLNADDAYELGAVSFAVDYFMKHHECDIIYGNVSIIDECGGLVGNSKAEPYSLDRLLVANFIKQPSVFMRRRVIDELMGVREELHYVMDWEFWLRAGIKFKFCYIPDKIFASFRLNPGTKSYDSVSEFSAEWSLVLTQALQDPNYAFLHEKIRRIALPQAQARYHIAEALHSIKNRKRLESVAHLTKAVCLDWKLLFNRGFFLFIYLGVSLRPPDRLRKYRPR